nr:UDP-2,4-diacetamido-2,4,6-trideoxy-beta-L-altropyranose hydrolase [Pseudomonas akapageensis]
MIRADASSSIGSGHVIRCMTLSAQLRAFGAQVTFACRSLDGHLGDQLQAAGYPVLWLAARYPGEQPGASIEAPLPWEADIAALQSMVPVAAVFDWILIDHYGLDRRWHRAARQWARRIAVIDDLANREHDADLLLDQNFTASAALYAPYLREGCRTLLGPHFALIRPEFCREPRAITARARRVLVNFGGFDPAGLTLKALQALAGVDDVLVDCIAGRANPAWAQLQVLCAQKPAWQLAAYAEDLPERMAAADLAIGAGGGTTWERCVLGVPTLCIVVADNQQANAQALAAAGGHLYLGRKEEIEVESLRQAIALMLGNPALRQSFADCGRSLVDGLGAKRVAVALMSEHLQLRAAASSDARLLFDGRNAPAVRRWAGNGGALDWHEHLAWLKTVLDDPKRLLLVAEAADGPVGILRYDRREQDRAEVSIYLFDGRFGVGWGRALLACGERFLRNVWPGLCAIEAKVLPSNQVSLALFQSAGFNQAECCFERVFEDQSQ